MTITDDQLTRARDRGSGCHRGPRVGGPGRTGRDRLVAAPRDQGQRDRCRAPFWPSWRWAVWSRGQAAPAATRHPACQSGSADSPRGRARLRPRARRAAGGPQPASAGAWFARQTSPVVAHADGLARRVPEQRRGPPAGWRRLPRRHRPDTSRVVKTGSISLVVDDGKVPATMIKLRQVAASVRGFLSEEKTQGVGSDPSGVATMRVPVASFDAVVGADQRQGLRGQGHQRRSRPARTSLRSTPTPRRRSRA